MDLELSNAWQQFLVSRKAEDGLALARLLLRLNNLDFYEKEMINNADILTIIHYLRQIAIPEAAKVISQLRVDILDPRSGTSFEPQFWTFRDPKTDERLEKFTNVYCHQIPVATFRIWNYQELRTTLDWCKIFFSPLHLMLPPKQISLNTIQGKEYFFVPTFKTQICETYEFIIEDEPAFDLNLPYSPPIYPFKHGQIPGMMKEVSKDEDYIATERGYRLKTFDYETLPTFAKPQGNEIPNYVLAGITTRHQTGGFSDYGDYGEWDNFTVPIAKIYVGFINNLLLADFSSNEGWSWSPRVYTYHCQACGIRVASEGNLRRCEDCGEYWDRTISHPTQIEINPHYPNSPEPPLHVNNALAFLESLYDHLNEGDIYSTRGGQELNIYLSAEEYGPSLEE